jgi:hypothetical protein
LSHNGSAGSLRSGADRETTPNEDDLMATGNDSLARTGRLGATCGLIAAAFSFAGCDLSGTHTKRYAEALVAVGQKAALDAMLAAEPRTVSPSTASLRLPSAIDDQYAKKLPVADPSAHPPFVTIPGLSLSLERLLDDPADAKKFAGVYCYLGAVPKAEKKGEALQSDVLKQVGVVFSGANWQDAKGSSLPGKLLSVKGPQDFAITDPDGKPGTAKLDGRMDLYFFETASHSVFIGFRAPNAQGTKYTIFDAAQASIGTLADGGGGDEAAAEESDK